MWAMWQPVDGGTRTMGGMNASGLLGDTTARDYSRKLQLFNAFAEPEIRQAIAELNLRPGMRVLDAGCGSGEALGWLHEHISPGGLAVGIDLASAHTESARTSGASGRLVAQANLLQPPLVPASIDLAWSVNTINHLHDPLAGVTVLADLLRPAGRLALGQSSLLPDMFFAWDSRLERLVTEAVRQYYRDRYQLEERNLTAVRAIFGVMRQAKLRNVYARTYLIERTSPVSEHDQAYLVEAIFRDTWGERLRPYLPHDDFQELSRLCDPQGSNFALGRPDFHFLQTFTLAVGEV
jgi:SAM-dependent methyltransferase